MNRNRHLRLVEGEHVKLWLMCPYGNHSAEWVEGRVTRSGNIRVEATSGDAWAPKIGSLLRLDNDFWVAGFTPQQIVDVMTERINTEFHHDVKRLEMVRKQRLDRLSKLASDAQ